MKLEFDARSVNEGFARMAVAAFVAELNPTLLAVIYGPGGLLINLRIDQTLRCKHRHKAGADDRKRQTKRKNALHQPIFFSVMIFPHSGALPAS